MQSAKVELGANGEWCDLYEVRDWEALRTVLAKEADIEVGPEDSWVRFTGTDTSEEAPGIYLSRLDDASLEVVAIGGDLDSARSWIEGVAGDIVTYLEEEEEEGAQADA